MRASAERRVSVVCGKRAGTEGKRERESDAPVLEQDADDADAPAFRLSRQLLVARLGHLARVVDLADVVHVPEPPLVERIPLARLARVERLLEVGARHNVVLGDVEVVEVELGEGRADRCWGRARRARARRLLGRDDAVSPQGVVELGVLVVVDRCLCASALCQLLQVVRGGGVGEHAPSLMRRGASRRGCGRARRRVQAAVEQLRSGCASCAAVRCLSAGLTRAGEGAPPRSPLPHLPLAASELLDSLRARVPLRHSLSY